MKMRMSFITLVISSWALVVSLGAVAQTKIQYGNDPMQYGEFFIPEGDGPFPVVTFLHAGCWSSSERLMNSFRDMAGTMNELGVAAWHLQFRGANNPGGGWPGTWLDMANGFDQLKEIAEDHPIDLDRVVIVGHSAGGHFGAWLAMRDQLPPNSEIYVEPQVQLQGLVIADAFMDPLVIDSYSVEGDIFCREPTLGNLVGGPVEENVDNFHQISPLQWLPWGVPQEYVVSTLRYPVSLPRHLAEGRTTLRMPDYPALAVQAGDEINVQLISNEGHGAFTRKGTRGYAATVAAALRMLGMAEW